MQHGWSKTVDKFSARFSVVAAGSKIFPLPFDARKLIKAESVR